MRTTISKPYTASKDVALVTGGIAFGDANHPNHRPDKSGAYALALSSLKSKMKALSVNHTDYPTGYLDSITRSDLVRNEMDAEGWRKPSAYKADWFEKKLVEFDGGAWAYFRPEYEERYNAGVYFTRCVLVGGYGISNFMLPAGLPPPSGPSSNTENMLLARALSQLSNQKFDLALSILEARESFGTLKGLIDKLRAIMVAIRKKDLGQLHKAFGFKTKNRDAAGTYIKDSGSLWLEAVYGISPIISDIYGLCDLLSSDLRTNDFRIVARSKATLNDKASRPIIPSLPFMERRTGTLICNHEITQKVALWYKMDSSSLNLATSLGLTNPAVWIWEKTTLSFVVDWLLPLGDVLSSLSADFGFTYQGGSHTYHYRSSGYLDGSVQELPNLAGAELINLDPYRPNWAASPTLFGGGMDRKVYPNSPKPTVFVKDPFSVMHVTTSIALVANFANLGKK